MIPINEIGAEIRRLRKERGLSIAELAESTGLRQATIRAIEGGQVVPIVGHLVILAKRFGVVFEVGIGASTVLDRTHKTSA